LRLYPFLCQPIIRGLQGCSFGKHHMPYLSTDKLRKGRS
jgi:hypothetical protein